MTQLQSQDNDIKLFQYSVLSSLEAKEFEAIEVPILQNADLILDTIGERARSELFFVENSNLEQNALRYDFTLAIARHYLAENSGEEKKYAAHGTVFRNRAQNKRHKQSEITQVSFEYMGHHERTKTDAECLAQALSLLDGFDQEKLNVGIADIKLSKALLSADFIPPIKSGRLKNALRQPKKFLSLLSSNDEQKKHSLSPLGKLPHDDAEQVISDIFTMTGLKHSGMRSLEEIRDRFVKKAEEAQEVAIDKDIAQMLRVFYNLECPAEEVSEKVRTIMNAVEINLDDYLQYFERRLDILRSYNVDVSRLSYGPLLKRKPEYYSGFMFSIDVVGADGKARPVGGGGRYDDLFLSLGSEQTIPAIGCEIRPEYVVNRMR